MDRFSSGPRRLACGVAALSLLSAACSWLGPPPLEPLTKRALDAAEQRWEAHGSNSYHLVVRVRPPRANPAVYDVVVKRGEVAGVERDGQAVPLVDTEDYSVSGLFQLLREDVRLTEAHPVGNTPPADLRVLFEAETGRLKWYRRTVGSNRQRVLLVEVLKYEPLAGEERHALAP
ncbi:MAG: hypothetical protein HYX77_06680 [Acidobacteria bacterium]|nr:hypothetical protein [Acidobacteriota bacterium]